MYEQFPELYPCVTALVRMCQIVVGQTMTVPSCVDFGALAAHFDDIPVPASYQDAICAVGVVTQFALRLGEHIHRCSFSRGERRSCCFEPETIAIVARLNPSAPEQWDAGLAVREWIERFRQAFVASHCPTVGMRVRQQIKQNRTIKVAELARVLGCSVPVLQRRFSTETGEPIGARRTKLRVAAAIELLRSSDLKVEAVAWEVGWKSRKDLYRGLRKFADLSPAQVRTLPETQARELLTRLDDA